MGAVNLTRLVSVSGASALLPLLVACGGQAPCPATPNTAPTSSSSGATLVPPPPGAPTGPEADLTLLVRPTLSPAAVHVEVTLTHADMATGAWHIARGGADRIAHAKAHDDGGDFAVTASAGSAGGVDLSPERAPHGATVTVGYDVLAGDDAPDDPGGLYVVEDRFRAAGEKLIALPAVAEGAHGGVAIRIDGEALKASGAASSLGVGAGRKVTVPFRALRYCTFVAGSLGMQVIDDPAAGHDEGAWLGYTAFDPRPTVAELAQMRSSLRELVKGGSDAGSWTYLFVSQTRPIGSFTTTPRWASALLQVGPAEPWNAGIRLSMAQQLARRWIGGEVRLAADAGHEAETAWFNDGVSRYLATALLARLQSLSPNETRDAITGELSVLATSPDGTMPNATLAPLVVKDDVARATAMARGALYALAESAAIRARSKGEKSLVDVLVAIVRQVEESKQGPLPQQAWLDAVSKEDPDAAKTFDALVTKGGKITLPAAALGPCFRPGSGEYVAFDPGFDLEATRASKDGKATGVRAGGPAAKAGLVEGDIIDSMQAREGDGTAPVKLVVVRGGSKVTLSYVPRGARGVGQTWTRVAGLADDKCGDHL